MTIDTSYFYGNLSIAQVSQPAVVSSVNWFINEFEPKLLTELLGYELNKNYQAGILANTQKYKDIRDGIEYTNRYNRLDKWKGLKFTMGTTPKSLIANYVYYWYMRDQATTTTGSGEKADKSAVSVTVSPDTKMVRAWNEMVQWNRELVEFLLSKMDDYPEFQTYCYTGTGNALAFGFPYARINSATSPIWNLLTPINILGF